MKFDIDVNKVKRIIVVGNNGSGKSYFSKKLSKITKLPLIHLDLLYWKPNWEHPTKEEWLNIQKELISQDEWIIDGNYTGTMELRFEAADCVFFLDVNRFLCLYCVYKRLSENRSDFPSYLEARKDENFKEFCKALWDFSKKRKPLIMNLHKKYPEKTFCIIKTRREVNKLLSDLEKQLEIK